MSSLSEAVLKAAAAHSEGVPITAREFLHLGSRAAIDQTMSRLTRSGQLVRIGQGLYLQPLKTRFGKRMPSPEKILAGIAERKGEQLAPSAAATANALGMTTQVPARTVYLTSGRTRRFKFGAQHVELRHAPAWQLREGAVGTVARILAWSGPGKATNAMETLGKALSAEQRQEVVASRAALPSWMAKTLSPWTNG